MTDFSPPFAHLGERRAPTAAELEQGFPCGPADQQLFNWLHWAAQGHIGEVITFAGITPTGDLTGLREAIEALIAAATGGGDTSQFLLVSQARARLPIFPEVLNADGRIVVTAPSTGTIRVPGGVDFIHRGIFPLVTAQTHLPTDPSKTYHLRWNTVDGFVLKDLASGTYNPTVLAESDVAFDSKYDDMLVARVVTNSSNVATITNLSNKHKLYDNTLMSGTDPFLQGQNGANFRFTRALNWGRTPTFYQAPALKATIDGTIVSNAADRDVNMMAVGAADRSDNLAVTTAPVSFPISRYQWDAIMMIDHASVIVAHFQAGA